MIAIFLGIIILKDKMKARRLAAEKLETGKNLEAGIIHNLEKDSLITAIDKETDGPDATDKESPPEYCGAVDVPPEKRGRGVSAWLQVTPVPEPAHSTVRFICWSGKRKALTWLPLNAGHGDRDWMTLMIHWE